MGDISKQHAKQDVTAQDCIDLLRRIRDASFATVDQTGAPQIRIIDVMLAEPGAIVFCTARGKDFYRQLIHDGRVAVTALSEAFQMVRFQGVARRLPSSEQHDWIDRIFDANPSMNDVYPKDARYVLEAFVLDNGELELFDLGTSPIYRRAFTLTGDGAADGSNRHGFTITDACIGCGACADACPQQCIEEGAPFHIRQEHCLHCGLCSEVCPVQAVDRKEVA